MKKIIFPNKIINSTFDNMAKRLKALMENYLEARKEGHKYGYEIRLVEPDNYEHYYILVKPIAGVYKDQKYVMEMKTTYGRGDDTTKYPINAPYVHFITNVFHVNVSSSGGSICLDILKDKQKWSPLNSFDTIVQNVLLLFNEPNNASPYNGEASRIWVACEKKYKSLQKPNMTVAESEELYIECFAEFIEAAIKVMNSSDLKQYAKWFPELDPDADEYKKRMSDDSAELEELEKTFAAMKARKSAKVQSTSSSVSTDVSSLVSADTSSSVSTNTSSSVSTNTSSSVSTTEPTTQQAPAKKNRWDKYRK